MPASFKLATIATAEGPMAALILDNRAIPIAPATGRREDASVMGLLADWENALPRLDAIAAAPPAGLALDEASLLAPIPLPGTIFCAGANYMDHAAEMAATRNLPPPPDPHEIGERPWHFIKSSHAVVGPGTEVTLPPTSQLVDWEVELAAVIGRKGKDIPEAEALAHVAGYTIANDLSARDLNHRPQTPAASPFRFDWVSHKNFDGSCPMGPWLVLARDIPDPQDLAMSLTVNDETKQDSHSGQMIFSLAEQIAELSRRMTLWPGDVILTGTPAGVGHAKGEKLKAGDVVRLRIAGLGELVNRMR